MKIVCLIPARYGSSRFPGKPLAILAGKPMIQHVYERAKCAKLLSYVAIVTDDKRIFEAVKNFGGEVLMTSSSPRSGTDRVAEAANILGMDADDIVVNVQGDQPLFEPAQINEVVEPLLADPLLPMATLIYRIHREEEIFHPHAVKVVFDERHFALYFSRATIPYVRDRGKKANYYKHHGIYAYRKAFLDIFMNLPPGKLEQWESLEQLRALESGYKIKVVESHFDSLEVDSLEELKEAENLIYKCGES